MRRSRFVPAFVSLAIVAVLSGVVYAAISLQSTISVTVAGTQVSTNDLGAAKFPVRFNKALELSSGTLADQSDRIFTDRRTLAASATEELDLAGSLTDAFGNTITFADVTAFVLCAADSNTNNVIFGAPAAATFKLSLGDNSDTVNVRPGGCFVSFASDATAYPVTATTGDKIKFANSAGSTEVSYDVVIVGRSS